MRRKSLTTVALLPVLMALLFVAGCGSIAGEKSIEPTSKIFRYCNPIYGAQNPDRCREMGVEYTGNPGSPYYGVGHSTIFTGPDGRDWICAHHHMKGCGPKGSDIHLGFDPIWIENGVVKTNGPTYTKQVLEIPAPRR